MSHSCHMFCAHLLELKGLSEIPQTCLFKDWEEILSRSLQIPPARRRWDEARLRGSFEYLLVARI